MSDMDVVVSPARRFVHLGQDAEFSCHARNVPGLVKFYWQVPKAILDSGRVEDNDDVLRIVNTMSADNNTDVSCLVLSTEGLQGTGVAELIVLPALPSTKPPTTTPGVTSKVGSTAKLVATETEKLTLSTTKEATTTRPTSIMSTATPMYTTPNPSTSTPATSTGTLLPSKVPNGPHQGPTQSPVDNLQPGTVAPAVVGGFVLLICVLITGIFLMRRYRRKTKDADAEKGVPAKHEEAQLYEFITPGSLDFKDGGNSDEENHNLKRHGNNYTNQDSLRTYSKGTAPDTVTRYAKAVPRKDRIVHAGGHGGKPRRAPVLTLSMNSLYEETTPTFVVANPKNGQVDVLPYRPNGEAVEIVGSLEETRFGQTLDEDQYVTLAHNPPLPANKDSNEEEKLF